ncbi:hypothetical protein Taro_047265 [Colocasia esculenta]|uniref:Receptor kinase-like protein Xa21 n=1 Tax=Colocasia esculenta TaxID=4460 RepID=A0A843WSD6_COLES|nr:hypothetical protein [Colocasia esculenta]
MANQLSHCCKSILLLLPYLFLCTTVYGSGADVIGAAPALGSNATDRLALLAFKDQIISGDPHGDLSSWNETLHFCSWQGVTCAGRIGRVRTLELPSQRLVGSLSPSLGNLTFLRELNLGDNLFTGTIPPELGKLSRLRTLNLTTNSLGGEIPANLSNCKQLRVLDLGTNALVGRIPSEITNLSKLKLLYLLVNNLTGVIPPSVGNLSSLTVLASGRNALRGRIPEEIGLISGLQFLQIAENQLSGAIPKSLTNLSSLYFLAIATNQLEGLLADLGAALLQLETLYGTHPSLAPERFGSYNHFIGSVPAGIGRLGGLLWLNLEGNNQLGAGEEDGLGFIVSLVNCTRLEMFDIGSNSFEGEMPASLANLSSRLSMLIMGDNLIRGSIPEGIENLASLSVLRLESNLLSGRIPASVGWLQGMQTLSLFGNRLSGQIPSNIGNITRLNVLRIDSNDLEGGIPSSLGACRSLQYMDAAQNMLNGTIPGQLLRLSSLSQGLRLSHNALVGPLPAEVGNLKNLWQLDLSENRLSGEVPASLGDCQSLEYLDMSGNSFSGSIPSSLNKLKGIGYIDLSRNKLAGRIPEYLGQLQALQHLNLSYNDLDGEVPQSGVFRNASAISIAGNIKLCGGVPRLRLPSCLNHTSARTKNRNHVLRILVPVLCVVSALIVLSCASFAAFLWIKKGSRREPHCVPPLGTQPMLISHSELFRATDGFSSENLIGAGSYGSVYMGVLDQNIGNTVAIKVLNLERTGAYKSFAAECEALRNIRHRNLVKIFTCCSSVDPSGNDFRALVFEFMPNGSLEQWLHPGERHASRRLTIAERLSIATDVACAIDYLHHHSHASIVHCDLKPSNVLLDDDMTAHVGDFGLARILSDEMGASTAPEQSKTVRVRGTIGYVPPEYGMGGDVSTEGDVYSYGILLLEMFTGLRPTDGTFKDGSTLREHAKVVFPERVMEILDP